MEKSYAFVVCVNGKPVEKFDWCCETKEIMSAQACAFQSGAWIFRETASVLVYEKTNDGMGELVHSVGWREKWNLPEGMPQGI